MANVFKPSDLISTKIAAKIGLYNAYIGNSNRQYEGMFSDKTYKSGETISFHQTPVVESQRGDIAVATDIVQRITSATILPLFTVYLNFKPSDLGREMYSLDDEIINPAVVKLSADIDNTIQEYAMNQINYFMGTPGSALSSHNTVALLGAYLEELGVLEENRLLSLSINDYATLKNSFPSLFTESLSISILRTGKNNHIDVFDLKKDHAIQKNIHTPYQGTMGTPQVKIAVASGNVITVKGLTASITGIYKIGDLISITDVWSIEQINKGKTSHLMQFLVTADADSDVSGDCDIIVSPTIESTGVYQNVSNVIPVDAFIYRGSETEDLNTPFKKNIGFSPKHLCLCMPPLEKFYSRECSVYRPVTKKDKNQTGGISVRVTLDSSPDKNKNQIRIDTQLAVTWLDLFTCALLT